MTLTDPRLPILNTVYIGGATIKPTWLRGRRLLVTAVLSEVGLREAAGYTPVALADVRAGQGLPPRAPLDATEAALIEVLVGVRGGTRTEYEQVKPADWDATALRGST